MFRLAARKTFSSTKLTGPTQWAFKIRGPGRRNQVHTWFGYIQTLCFLYSSLLQRECRRQGDQDTLSACMWGKAIETKVSSGDLISARANSDKPVGASEGQTTHKHRCCAVSCNWSRAVIVCTQDTWAEIDTSSLTQRNEELASQLLTMNHRQGNRCRPVTLFWPEYRLGHPEK